MPVDFISATKPTRSHHIEYKCYLLQYDHNNSKGIRKLVRQPANTRNNISGLGVWMYPLGPLFPRRGLPLYIRKYQSVFPPLYLSYSKDTSNDTVEWMSRVSSNNSPARGAGFIRCISASHDRETDTRTLYFHWGGTGGFPAQAALNTSTRGLRLTLVMLFQRLF